MIAAVENPPTPHLAEPKPFVGAVSSTRFHNPHVKALRSSVFYDRGIRRFIWGLIELDCAATIETVETTRPYLAGSSLHHR